MCYPENKNKSELYIISYILHITVLYSPYIWKYILNPSTRFCNLKCCRVQDNSYLRGAIIQYKNNETTILTKADEINCVTDSMKAEESLARPWHTPTKRLTHSPSWSTFFTSRSTPSFWWNINTYKKINKNVACHNESLQLTNFFYKHISFSFLNPLNNFSPCQWSSKGGPLY